MVARENALNIWLKKLFPDNDYLLSRLAGDASHRIYYRLKRNNENLIVMDSSPELESFSQFIKVCNLLKEESISVPMIHNLDIDKGYAILDDFGESVFLQELSSRNSDQLYKSALLILAKMQPSANFAKDLQVFDKSFMLTELVLFDEWFIKRYLGLKLTKPEQEIMKDTFDWLTTQITKQPQVFVHLDYHSRNIMIIDDKDLNTNKLGVIDFQDAKRGPYTYDLVSLLKDCYIQLTQKQIDIWVEFFYNQISPPNNCSLVDFVKDFNLCGLQRHLKVLGVFSRLYIRDNKPSYLQNIPRIINYIMGCLECFPELELFQDLMLERIQPSFISKIT
ncbi:MAG: phosphotransferase [Legionellaceae bacterium]|nr:phosphotransferase [Legionellaceae bacterium]